ncbi:MAG: hypothetical protein GY898_06275 [Proteobacteria bacterium]|nr:hypothetical protein [Pseudomonadota bacterium]
MRTTARLFLVFALLFTLNGCPELSLGNVGLKAGTVKGGSFTVTAQIHVTEVDDTTAEGATPQEGRGMIGIMLPPGWTVADARMSSPFEGSVRRLIPVPQVAAAFGQTFPQETGHWWTFASNTIAIPTGSHTFDVEVDVVAGKKAKGGVIGVAAGQLSEDLSELPAPRKFDLSLKGKGSLTAVGGATSVSLPPEPEPANTDKASGG